MNRSQNRPLVIWVRNRVSGEPGDHDRDRAILDAAAEGFSGVDFWSVPFLYDLPQESALVRQLATTDGPTLVMMSLGERAIRALAQSLGIGKNGLTVASLAVVDSDAIRLRVAEFLASSRPDSALPEKSAVAGRVEFLTEPTERRWYPVLDTAECLGCLECVNFCLFGVWTVGEGDRPLVENPDACRDGCPACSRVCPGGAILFPLYDDPLIAGKTDAETVRRQTVGEAPPIERAETERSSATAQEIAKKRQNAAGVEIRQFPSLDELVERTDPDWE